MAEFIYTLRKARKAHGDKVILDDVTLSFLPGAKIGVVGPNGAGKSTVLKIMAGLEQPSNGDAHLSPGYTVGILLQEPRSTSTKNVLENVQQGVAETQAPDRPVQRGRRADGDRLHRRAARRDGHAPEQMDHRNAWDLDAQLEQAMDALRCPPGDADIKVLSGGERRRVALCKLLLEQPDLLLLDEPTNHLDAESVQWLEQHLAKYAGHRRRHHPRPVLPGQRRAVDPRTRPRPRLPVRGQLLDLPGDQVRADEGRGPEGRQARQAAARRARVGPLQRQGPAGQVQGAAGPLRGDGRRGGEDPQARLRGDPDPAGPAPGQRGRRRRASSTRASASGC